MARKSKTRRKTSRGKKKPDAPDEFEKALSPLPALPSFADLPTFTLQSHTPTSEKSPLKRPASAISGAEGSSTEAQEDEEADDSSNRSKRQCTSNKDEDTPQKPTKGDDEGWQQVPVKRKKDVSNRGDSYPEFSISSQRINVWTRIADLQSLILHILSHDAAPQWMLIKNKSAIRRVVCLFVPGLSMELFDGRVSLVSKSAEEEGEDSKTAAPRSTLGEYIPVSLSQKSLAPPLLPLSEMFTHILPVRAGGDNHKLFSPVHNMLNVPVDTSSSSTDNKKSHSRRSPKKPRLKISDLLLSTEELIENEYPIHTSQIPEDHKPSSPKEDETDESKEEKESWFETSLASLPPRTIESGSILEGYKVFSMDCEMVKTSSGPALARISLISWDGTVAFDSLVKPTEPILDYLTPFSGITEAMLRDITTTRTDVQAKLKELIDGNTVLIGQSLNSDFNALKMRHPWIVDTSVLYDHPRGKPMKPSLKWLSQKYLKKEIQSHRSNGHDSIEDARACLELVKLKLEKGREFGSAAANFESIFTKLAGAKPPRTGGVVDYGDVEKKYGAAAQFTKRATTDDQVVEGVLKAVNGDVVAGIAPVDFTWAQFRELNETRGWNNSYQKFITQMNATMITETSPPIEIPEKPTALHGSELGTVVENTVARIKRVYEGLPKCSALVVYSGTGDPVEMGRLNALQAVYRKEFKVKKWDECSVRWTDDEEQALRRAVAEARKGIALLAVK